MDTKIVHIHFALTMSMLGSLTLKLETQIIYFSMIIFRGFLSKLLQYSRPKYINITSVTRRVPDDIL